MGKLEDSSSINHFSHEHPLKLQNSQTQIGKNPCSACKINISESFYACVSCDFYLHKTCSTLPRTLKHKSDNRHNLVLLSSPAYPEGVFRCNACGSHGTGFSYHCPDCQLDLHTTCASMPLAMNHGTHSHTLTLCFKPPYSNHGFSCDICKEPGSHQWLYRCGPCEFDAHMKCVKQARTSSRSVLAKSASTVRPNKTHEYWQPPPPPQLPPLPPMVPPVQTYYSPAPAPVQYSQANHYQVAPAMGVPQYAQSSIQNGFVNNIAGHAVEGLVGSLVEAAIEGMIS